MYDISYGGHLNCCPLGLHAVSADATYSSPRA